MSDGKALKRKSMAAVGSVIGEATDNCIVNQATLITLWKKSNPFVSVIWAEPTWDVATTYASRERGYKSSGTSHSLLFTQHSKKARVAGEPLAGVFGEVIKALVCARHTRRGQTVASHMVFVRATRYVYDVLKSVNHDVSLITPAHLDLAASAVFKREAETTAYKVVGHMEEFADMLDANRLCKIRLDWRCHGKARPKKLAEDRIEDAPLSAEPDDRLPKEDVIRSLGWLYQNIPREDTATGAANPDRIATLITTILVCTGVRVGEVLTLPEHPIVTERDGTKSLRYARLKGRLDHLTVEWKVKPLLSATVDLVEEAVEELRQLTEGARNVARDFAQTGRLLAGERLKPILGPNEVRLLVGLNSNGVAQFLKLRDIPYEVVAKRIQVKQSEFLTGVTRDHWTRPMLPGSKENQLELHHALCVVYTNQMHRGTRSTLTYAAQPVSDLQMRDFLTGRTGTKNVFERYGIVDTDGQAIDIRSKGFRHFLNNLLDEGGAPDLVQTKWFGRKNPADTKAYQHLTTAQRARKVVDDIMAGKVKGAVADLVKVLPTEVAKAFLISRIQAVHDVGPGMCVHDFQMMPCPRHLQCDANCDEYVWEKGDRERKDALLRQAAMVQSSIRAALSRKAAGGIVRTDWMRHLKARYRQLLAQMKTSGLNKADIEHYIAENDSDNAEVLADSSQR